MVASKVRVVSRAFGSDAAYAWESDGTSGYTVDPALPGERDGEGDHGSTVTLYLRESTEDDNTDQLLSEWRLKSLVRTYSNYVHYPIRMEASKRRELPRPEDAGDDYKPEYESYTELETVNSIKPIWGKRSSEVSQSDYNEFYKATFHDYNDPARVVSFHAEGRISYDVLLFIPSVAPFDLYSKDYQKGLALYQSGVLIQEKCGDLVPDYFNFVRGVVDSPDVSLNISRETLQQNSQLKAIARQVEKKIRAELAKMLADDREGYEKFFQTFGRGIKFGIYSTYGMKAGELADLVLFWSGREGKYVTLCEYVDAMPEGQAAVYYAAGESRERLQKMPAVKNVLAGGYDVLLCTEDVDEFMIQAMRAYHIDAVPAAEEGAEPTPERDVEFTNVADAKLDLASEEEKEKAAAAATEHGDLVQTIKDALGEKVAKVEIAAGLGEAPAALAAEGSVSLEMERLMGQGPDAGYAPKAERVLKINPDHPVFAKLVAAQEAHDATKVALYADVLLDQALLVAGMPVEDPVAFAENVCKLM
jgi:molecular chaperone HtpG